MEASDHLSGSAGAGSPGDNQWPPSIDVVVAPVPPTLPGFMGVVATSMVVTVVLFFVWLRLAHDFGVLAYYVMPIVLGLALSYCWRRMGFRMSLHLTLLWENIAILGACSLAVRYWLAKAMPAVGATWTPVEHKQTWLLPFELLVIVVASLIGRALFAPRGSRDAAENTKP